MKLGLNNRTKQFKQDILNIKSSNDDESVKDKKLSGMKSTWVKKSTPGWNLMEGKPSDFVEHINDFGAIAAYEWGPGNQYIESDKEGYRNSANMKQMTTVIIDVDEQGDFEKAKLQDGFDKVALAYPSVRDGIKGQNKYRLVIPLNKDLVIGEK